MLGLTLVRFGMYIGWPCFMESIYEPNESLQSREFCLHLYLRTSGVSMINENEEIW